MSYKLRSGLSSDPDFVELADYWEIECLRKVDHSASLLDIAKSFGIIEDVQEDEVEEKEIELDEKLQNVVNEIERRKKSCAGKYPFKLNDTNYILSPDDTVPKDWHWLYIYLLLATRNDMHKEKRVNDIDGTLVFEKVSKDSLVGYLGKKAQGLIFGTAAAGNFYEKLEELIKVILDGELKLKQNGLTYNPQDDKLDIVAWIPFEDEQPSKVICFAQCKTGTHWIGTIEQLNVSSFLKKWFSDHPIVDPLRTFMIADIVNPKDFKTRTVNNLFMDRCRVASSFEMTADNNWFIDMKNWTQGVMDEFSLSIPA